MEQLALNNRALPLFEVNVAERAHKIAPNLTWVDTQSEKREAGPSPHSVRLLPSEDAAIQKWQSLETPLGMICCLHWPPPWGRRCQEDADCRGWILYILRTELFQSKSWLGGGRGLICCVWSSKFFLGAYRGNRKCSIWGGALGCGLM